MWIEAPGLIISAFSLNEDQAIASLLYPIWFVLMAASQIWMLRVGCGGLAGGRLPAPLGGSALCLSFGSVNSCQWMP